MIPMRNEASGRIAFARPAQCSPVFFAPDDFDKAGCARRKGVPLRSTERAGERAPLTAAASGQVIHLSGAKKTKENL